MNFDRPNPPDLAAAATRYAHIARSLAAHDRDARCDPDRFLELGEAGLLALPIAAEHGGAGASGLELYETMFGFGVGAGDAGLALTWATHLLQCAIPLWRLGDDAQRRRYLSALCRGTAVGTLADRGHFRAATAGDRWILDGTAPWVINAPVAGVILVPAVTDRGPTMFIVEPGAPGVRTGSRIETAGLRTATLAELTLERCELSDRQRLGAVGRGEDGVALARRWEHGCGLAPWIGILQALVDRAIELVHGRSTQAVRARIADMKIGLELARRVQERAAWAVDRPDAGEDGATRAFVLRTLRGVTQHAAEIAGSDALAITHPIARLQRDAATLASLAL